MLPPHRPNTVLHARYELLETVGQGGMGCIYKAADTRLPGRFCAIKEVHADPFSSPEDRTQLHDQFLTEASVLARLDHPNLPKVSDFFTDDGREYLVMDFVPGQDLKQMIDAQIQVGELFEINMVMDWAEQILDTLIYLHERDSPVVHRDIKPANIKLMPDGRIKLVDFGLVKLLIPDEQRTLTVMQGRGSALYTPLEQYGGDGGSTDVRSDIYSFGATLYHLLALKVPADAKARFLNPRVLKPLAQLNPMVTSEIESGIEWAMAMHPDDRPNSIRQLRDVLNGEGTIPQSESAAVVGGLSAENKIIDAFLANQLLIFITGILAFIAVVLTLI
ncbi:MAG TPA: serine/threonine protein kinase [Anaerolineae bacterium]|nr:serine/threonine protein kinase [Anaerolineae bacterium]